MCSPKVKVLQILSSLNVLLKDVSIFVGEVISREAERDHRLAIFFLFSLRAQNTNMSYLNIPALCPQCKGEPECTKPIETDGS